MHACVGDANTNMRLSAAFILTPSGAWNLRCVKALCRLHSGLTGQPAGDTMFQISIIYIMCLLRAKTNDLPDVTFKDEGDAVEDQTNEQVSELLSQTKLNE
jgi:hypothetical protein